METVKVDVLVVGNLLTSSYTSLGKDSHLWTLRNVKVDPDKQLHEIVSYGIKFNVRNATIIRALESGSVNLNSLLVGDGKVIAVIGEAKLNVRPETIILGRRS